MKRIRKCKINKRKEAKDKGKGGLEVDGGLEGRKKGVDDEERRRITTENERKQTKHKKSKRKIKE